MAGHAYQRCPVAADDRAGLPVGSPELSRDSLTGATSVGQQAGAVGDATLAVARTALVDGMHVTPTVGGVVLLCAPAAAAAVLHVRRAR